MIKSEILIVVLVAILGTGVVSYVGANSDIYLGDEPTHYLTASSRYDKSSLYNNRNVVNKDILWHALLGGLWGLSGQKSQLIAQLYQSCWYFLLVLSVYLLGRELYNKTTGMYGAILCATMPFTIAYSTMLYLDIPMMALATLTFWMIIRQNLLLAGVLMTMAVSTKINALFLLPSFLTFVFLANSREKVLNVGELVREAARWLRVNRRGLLNVLLFSIPTLFLFIYYLLQRQEPKHSKTVFFLHPENIILHPSVVLLYLGVAVLLCLGLYLINKNKDYEKGDTLLCIPIVSYVFIFLLTMVVQAGYEAKNLGTFRDNLLGWAYSGLCMRYFSPIFPMFALIAGKKLLSINRRDLKFVLLSVAFAQIFVTAVYIKQARTIPEPLHEAYNFLSTVYPANQVIFSNKAALSVYTPHICIWSKYKMVKNLEKLYWSEDDEEILKVLKDYKVRYLFVEKDMIFDDSKIRNTGGYPKSFVGKLPQIPFLELVYSNSAADIWKVETTKTKKSAQRTEKSAHVP